MAARRKSKKKVVSRKVRSSGFDQNSFLLVLGGGFVVIVLVSFFLGTFSMARSNNVSSESVEGTQEATRETVITIQNNTFSSPVIVKKGTKVTFMNNDTSDHTVVSDDGSFDLGVITTAEPKSFTFEEEGTYTYHCTMHPGMEGTVIVE